MFRSQHIWRMKFLEDSRRMVSQAMVLTILIESEKPADNCQDQLIGQIQKLRDLSAMHDAVEIRDITAKIEKLLRLVVQTEGILRSETLLLIRESLDHTEQLIGKMPEYTVKDIYRHRKLITRLDNYLEKRDRKFKFLNEQPRTSSKYNPVEEALIQSAYRRMIPARI